MRENRKKRQKRIRTILTGMTVLFLAFSAGGCGGIDSADVTIVNISYDPTRNLYEEYNKLFSEEWEEQTGESVEIVQSHGGSGSQASSVINGLKADVVTLAVESDIDKIAESGLIADGWIDEFPNDSAPYTSTIVLLVRKGNPKGIRDWDDLIREDVEVITPNPKTSGGAKWNYLAVWEYASERFGGNETKTMEFMKKLFGNVLSLASGARGAASSFIEDRQGDVLIAWENEALQSVNDNPGEYEILSPSVSILAQPQAAVVDHVVDQRGTRAVAEAYLSGLYTDEAQRIIGRNYYRPSSEAVLSEFADVFDLGMRLVTIADFGGWEAANEKHFSNGGTFDQIYEK